MPRRETSPISGRLLKALDQTASEFRERGVRMFLFGSLARTYPESHRGADLDIGYEARGGATLSRDLEREIERAVRQLPTVRPVDLVNFNTIGPDFARTAKRRIVELPANQT